MTGSCTKIATMTLMFLGLALMPACGGLISADREDAIQRKERREEERRLEEEQENARAVARQNAARAQAERVGRISVETNRVNTAKVISKIMAVTNRVNTAKVI